MTAQWDACKLTVGSPDSSSAIWFRDFGMDCFLLKQEFHNEKNFQCCLMCLINYVAKI